MALITQIKTRKEKRKEARKKRKRYDQISQDETESSVVGNSKNNEPSSDRLQTSSKTSTSFAKPKSSTEDKSRKKKKIKAEKNDAENPSSLYVDHPDVADALRRDEAEIAELEKRLGLTGGKKGKEKLNKEYAKLEGYGDDFGDFLDDLDHMVSRVMTTDKYSEDAESVSSKEEDSDGETEAANNKSKKKERVKDLGSGQVTMEEDCDSGFSYGNLDPAVADALNRDDEEIAALEKKLGISKPKEKNKLYKEYSKLEGYGDDFGDFLDDLDGMMARIQQPGNNMNYYSDREQPEDGNGHSGGSSEDESKGEEFVRMKGSSDEFDEDDSVLEELERMQREENGGTGNSNDAEGSDGEESSDEEQSGDSASSGNKDDDSEDDSMEEDKIEPDHDVSDTYQPSKGEDIYGKKIDSGASGNNKPSKYVPPHLRKKQELAIGDEEENERRRAILRSLNNSLNRLSEDTLISVAQQIAALYLSNPTPLVHELIWKNAKDACITSPMLMVGLIPVYTACITGVHIQTGDTVQVGENILERVVVELLDRLKVSREAGPDDIDDNRKNIESKQIINMMLFLGYLYNYGIVHCSFLYDIIRHLIENFSQADVECLLILLSHCGRSLRSDDPMALKEIVLLVQKKKAENGKQSSSSRTEYMISAIMDLKNNRRKKEDTVFTEKAVKFRKVLGRIKASAAKAGLSKSSSEASLRISLDDILQAETKGRWWKVGASWVGNQYRFTEEESKQENEKGGDGSRNSSTLKAEDGDEELLKLASKFRMNTDRKRSIFCIVMGGTDCEDTFEKLCRSSMLQNRNERDTVRVLMECCGNEKSYNKFYGHLAARICEYQPQSKFSLQLAYWDIFKQFDSIGARKAANLAKLLFHLVVTHHALKILPVIKTIDLSDADDMDENTLIFLTILLSSTINYFDDPSEAKAVFAQRVSRSEDESGEDDSDETIRAGLLVFFMETLKSSPKNKKGSRFRKNFKAIVKELDTDGFEDMF
uniref:MI domain-containing protein n=1 Tax=Pseudo-nitzschia australis TaxID=44445 RepID=A0A7S4AX47_9STRA